MLCALWSGSVDKIVRCDKAVLSLPSDLLQKKKNWWKTHRTFLIYYNVQGGLTDFELLTCHYPKKKKKLPRSTGFLLECLLCFQSDLDDWICGLNRKVLQFTEMNWNGATEQFRLCCSAACSFLSCVTRTKLTGQTVFGTQETGKDCQGRTEANILAGLS